MAALGVAAAAAAGLPAAAAQPAPAAPADAVAPEAWLPHPMPAPAVPSVAFVGDSIGRDAGYHVRGQVGRTHPIAYYHAVAAGYTGYHLPRLLPVIRPAGGPDILLVELGTGDAFWDHSTAQFEQDVRRFLDAVLPYVTCVRWFDQKPTANYAYPEVNEHRLAFNAVLARVLAERRYASRNVALVTYSNWYRLAGDRGFFLADGLHHTEAGRRELGLLAGQAAEGCDPADTSGPFWDVPDRVPSADAISWLGERRIALAFRNGTYRAELGSFAVPLERGQLADLLWRLVGSPSAPRSSWHDIPNQLRPAANWIDQQRVMRGYPDGTFRPTGKVTRGALATYLWRLAGRPDPAGAPRSWPDVPRALAPAVTWVVETGLMQAHAGGTFGTGSVVTRAQVARPLRGFARWAAAAAAATTTTAPPDVTPTTTTTPPPTAEAPPGVVSTTIAPAAPPATTPTTVPPATLPPATVPPATIPPATPPADG